MGNSNSTFKTNKVGRRLGDCYTQAEDRKILDSIREKRAWRYTGGVEFWKQLSEQAFKNKRTYESLKSHFENTLVKNLSESDAELHRAGRKTAELFMNKNRCPLFSFSECGVIKQTSITDYFRKV